MLDLLLETANDDGLFTPEEHCLTSKLRPIMPKALCGAGSHETFGEVTGETRPTGQVSGRLEDL